MQKIAITGNIACGKSTVEKFVSKYYKVYDTDKIAHKLLDNITYFEDLDIFTNGKVDRKKLGDLVFVDKNLRKKLENIIHPQIKKELEKIFEENKNEKYIFVSIPLLFEVGWENLFDKILMITVNEDIQLQRLINRNHFTKDEALKRIYSQIPQNKKIKKANYIIENNNSIDDLENKINELLLKF